MHVNFVKKPMIKSLQPSENKFAGIHFCYSINSGENDEKYFGRLFGLYENKVKENKLKIPPKFDRYHLAYLWLRSQPKFGSHFEDRDTRDIWTTFQPTMTEMAKMSLTCLLASLLSQLLLLVHVQ